MTTKIGMHSDRTSVHREWKGEDTHAVFSFLFFCKKKNTKYKCGNNTHDTAQFTITFFSAASLATDPVSPITTCLLVEYITIFRNPQTLDILAALAMPPPLDICLNFA